MKDGSINGAQNVTWEAKPAPAAERALPRQTVAGALIAA
jgi:hypothetical protein